MDELDRRILDLLQSNARMTIKEIARQVSLTSPAVSERVRRMEKSGVIAGYTARINPEPGQSRVGAYVSISVKPENRPDFLGVLQGLRGFVNCCQVTGTYSHMVRVDCKDIEALEKLLSKIQKFGQTNTQIILATFYPEAPGAAPVYSKLI